MGDSKRSFILTAKLDTNLTIIPGYPAGVWAMQEFLMDAKDIEDDELGVTIFLDRKATELRDSSMSYDIFDGTLDDYMSSHNCAERLPSTIWSKREEIEPFLKTNMDVVVSTMDKQDFAVYLGEGKYQCLRGKLTDDEIEFVMVLRTKSEMLAEIG